MHFVAPTRGSMWPGAGHLWRDGDGDRASPRLADWCCVTSIDHFFKYGRHLIPSVFNHKYN